MVFNSYIPHISGQVLSIFSIFSIRNVMINNKKTNCKEKCEIVLPSPSFQWTVTSPITFAVFHTLLEKKKKKTSNVLGWCLFRYSLTEITECIKRTFDNCVKLQFLAALQSLLLIPSVQSWQHQQPFEALRDSPSLHIKVDSLLLPFLLLIFPVLIFLLFLIFSYLAIQSREESTSLPALLTSCWD